MRDTKSTDPAFSKEPDTMSGTYIDVNGIGRDITLVLHYPENDDSSIKEPLTKREYMATQILVSLVSDSDYQSQTPEQLAHHAVRHADALVSRINDTQLP